MNFLRSSWIWTCLILNSLSYWEAFILTAPPFFFELHNLLVIFMSCWSFWKFYSLKGKWIFVQLRVHNRKIFFKETFLSTIELKCLLGPQSYYNMYRKFKLHKLSRYRIFPFRTDGVENWCSCYTACFSTSFFTADAFCFRPGFNTCPSLRIIYCSVPMWQFLSSHCFCMCSPCAASRAQSFANMLSFPPSACCPKQQCCSCLVVLED